MRYFLSIVVGFIKMRELFKACLKILLLGVDNFFALAFKVKEKSYDQIKL